VEKVSLFTPVTDNITLAASLLVIHVYEGAHIARIASVLASKGRTVLYLLSQRRLEWRKN